MDQSGPVPDPVEAALAEAIRQATAAGHFTEVVRLAELARDLRAGRIARADVIALDAERAKRGR